MSRTDTPRSRPFGLAFSEGDIRRLWRPGVCPSVALFRFAFVPRLPPSEREPTLRRSRRGFSSRRLTSLPRRGGLTRRSSPTCPTLALPPRRGGRTSTLRPDRACAAVVPLSSPLRLPTAAGGLPPCDCGGLRGGRTSTLRPDRTFAADFHSLPTAWRGVGLGFAPSNDNERISTPRPWGIAAKFVPKSAKGFRSPTGAALIHPLSAHRIICGLPSGSGETRRLAKHPSGRLRRCPSGSAYSKTERGSFPTKQACRKTVALGFPPPAGVSP